jgi:diacylglycerol kinase (ATP)
LMAKGLPLCHFLRSKMPKKKKILFVVNPTAGTRTYKFEEALIQKWLDHNRFSYEMHITRHAGDGTDTIKARLEDFDGFIAVGGDGTVNDVFKGVLGTKKWFGIIPSGSGNGLARTLNIPMNIEGAFKALNAGKVKAIDYVNINDDNFVNVAGIGFDAKVAHKFKNLKVRGLKSYAKVTLEEFGKTKGRPVKISFKGKTIKEKAMMVSFANSTQFGNNAYISPKAELDDGKVNIVVLKKFHWLDVPFLVWQLFSKSIHQSRLQKEYAVKKATIESKKGIYLHIDGEARAKVNKVKLKVIRKGVKVIA